MSISSSDITLNLSGGSSNSDPSSSLGGSPSAFPIASGINNLFDNVSEDERLAGHVDYRCFYYFNNNATDSFYNAKVFIQSETDGGASIQLGVRTATDIQTILIDSDVASTSGSFTLSFESETAIVAHNIDAATWGMNLENAVNSFSSVSGASVSTTVIPVVGGDAPIDPAVIFSVSFGDADDFRNQELLEIDSNDLTGSPSITITKSTEGGPVNEIAAEIDTETTPPSGVVFIAATEASPISLGTLRPTDGVPIWIKRTTLEGAVAVAADGVKIRLTGGVTS